MYDEEVYAERALDAGARGYIEKSQSPVALVTAMRQVLGGQIYLSEAMTGRLLEAVADGGEGATRAVDRLSDRELEVFELLGGGATTREVARRLGLSVKTVESYRENIKNKLGIDNSNRLIRRAVEWTLQQG
jgi:DNA-binding NarL/FixJ family response regulator